MANEPITLSAPELPLAFPPASKWAREHLAFRQLLPQLLNTHRGQFVAVHDGRVIAAGQDKIAVAMDALRQVGNVAVHVGLVSEQPEPVVRSGARRDLSSSGGVS